MISEAIPRRGRRDDGRQRWSRDPWGSHRAKARRSQRPGLLPLRRGLPLVQHPGGAHLGRVKPAERTSPLPPTLAPSDPGAPSSFPPSPSSPWRPVGRPVPPRAGGPTTPSEELPLPAPLASPGAIDWPTGPCRSTGSGLNGPAAWRVQSLAAPPSGPWPGVRTQGQQ